MLQGKLADVGANFKEVLEVRTKNIQASRSRTENFVSSVSSKSQVLDPQRSDSPLYNPSGRRTPQPGFQGGSSDLLTLDPSNPSPLGRPSFQTDQQLLVMEEAQTNNTYIQARGEAIDAIERTISELGGIFGQLAQMVSEQSEMIQRIDANTEDVVDNVEGAQRELMKYWSRVSGNRWLIAKMFGVLMVRFSLLDAVAGANETTADFLPSLGFDSRIDIPLIFSNVLLRALASCSTHRTRARTHVAYLSSLEHGAISIYSGLARLSYDRLL
jgi:syntaxin 5